MKIKKIYCFAYYDLREPSVRYRGKYMLSELEKTKGIAYNIVYPGYSPKNILYFFFVFLSVLFSDSKQSLIIYQNIYSQRGYAFLLKLLLTIRPHNTIYDIDDADYLRFPPETIHYFMKRCSVCTVGSIALKEYALQYNEQVLLLTSPIIEHQEVKKDRNNTITIGWIGFYNAHKDSVEQLFLPALDSISLTVRLVLLGVTNPEHREQLFLRFAHKPNIHLEIPVDINWQDEEGIYKRVKTFDIGISPLLPTEMNIAKSAFKLKQYLSCGVPVLGSDTGENKRFLVDGENGFFCHSSADYRKYIGEIASITDSEYNDMSRKARASLSKFSMEQYCSSLTAFFEQDNSDTPKKRRSFSLGIS